MRRLDVSPQDCSFIQKETLAKAFSCEFSKISKNTFFHRTPLVAASIRIFCHRTELNKIKKLKINTRLYAHVTSPIHRTDKYSQHSSIVWPVWLNGRVFVYELSGCGLESSCSHLNFTFHSCFEQGVLWHSGNYIVLIHSETRIWHDKNIQSKKIESRLNLRQDITLNF